MTRWLFWGALGLLGCTYSVEETDQAETDTSSEAIVGGTDANIADSPWQVYIQTGVATSGDEMSYYGCGGSIIASSWVLSAQHCFTNMDNGEFVQPWASPRDVYVVAGTDDLTEEGVNGAQVRQAKEIIPLSTYTGDVADGGDAVLVRVFPPFDLDDPNVVPIELLKENAAEAGFSDPGVEATATGWGNLDNAGTSPTQLQTLQVPIVDNAVATAVYGFPMTDTHIAAGHLTGVDGTCYGDSGGPLVVFQKGEPRLAGITSFGSPLGCASSGYPDVYTRVSAIRSWVLETRRTTLSDPFTQTFNQGQSSLRTVTVTIPEGAVEMTVELHGTQGDGDVFANHGSAIAIGNRYSADCYSDAFSSYEYCPIHNPTPGTWHLSTYAWSPLTNVVLTVRYRMPK
jgi:secreted trypsin-like serine protease